MTIRANLELTEATNVTWHPFIGSVHYKIVRYLVPLSLSRVSFLSDDSWESYLGDRHWRQFYDEFQLARDPVTPRVSDPRVFGDIGFGDGYL